MRAVPNKLKDHKEKRECPSKLSNCHTSVFQAVNVQLLHNWKFTYLKKVRLEERHEKTLLKSRIRGAKQGSARVLLK